GQCFPETTLHIAPDTTVCEKMAAMERKSHRISFVFGSRLCGLCHRWNSGDIGDGVGPIFHSCIHRGIFDSTRVDTSICRSQVWNLAASLCHVSNNNYCIVCGYSRGSSNRCVLK